MSEDYEECYADYKEEYIEELKKIGGIKIYLSEMRLHYIISLLYKDQVVEENFKFYRHDSADDLLSGLIGALKRIQEKIEKIEKNKKYKLIKVAEGLSLQELEEIIALKKMD
jgi:hypothetical protein